MATDRVAFFAGEGHFLDHLLPVFEELPEHHRAGFFVLPAVEDHARARGLDPVLELPPPGVPTVVSAIGDLRRVTQDDRARPMILAEHGAGQTYGTRSPSYAGGIGRDGVVLFVVPNMHAARRNRARYPRTPNAVVGCPKLDRLLGSPAPPGPPVAVLSFHWRCRVAPETNTALDHFLPALESTRDLLDRHGVELRAHAHPRLLAEAGPLFAELGLPVVADFEEVVRTAHVYGVDNSSTLFEFAALDRPVVVLNAPGYRKGVRHGLRFWTAADVGVQIDDPELLADGFLRALDDPDELKRSRGRALAEVYPVRDGTSSRRAANAIFEAVVRTCPACGGAHGSCTSPGYDGSSVVAVDERVRRAPAVGSPKKRYKNPTGPGFVRLSDERARRMGLLPEQDAPAEEAPVILSSDRAGIPEGALAPGGPTARARRRRAAAEALENPGEQTAREALEKLGALSPEELEELVAAFGPDSGQAGQKTAKPAPTKKRDAPSTTSTTTRRRPAGGK